MRTFQRAVHLQSSLLDATSCNCTTLVQLYRMRIFSTSSQTNSVVAALAGAAGAGVALAGGVTLGLCRLCDDESPP